MLQLIPRVQAVVRGLVYRVWYWRVQDAVRVVQSFGRMVAQRKRYEILRMHPMWFSRARPICAYGKLLPWMVIIRYLRRVGAIRAAQQFLRFSALRSWFRKKTRAANKVKGVMMSFLRTRKVNAWFSEMDRACRLGDVEMCRELMRRERPPFDSLRRLAGVFLVNMRDQVYFTSLVHSACRSGSLETLKYLVRGWCRAWGFDRILCSNRSCWSLSNTKPVLWPGESRRDAHTR